VARAQGGRSRCSGWPGLRVGGRDVQGGQGSGWEVKMSRVAMSIVLLLASVHPPALRMLNRGLG